MSTYSPETRSHESHRCLASRLVGCVLSNANGEQVGVVEDVVFDRSIRCVAYVVVAFGGFLGMGGKSFAMPWRRFTFGDLAAGRAITATLDVARDDLVASPGFAKGRWPDFADLRWEALVEAHYHPGQLPESLRREAGVLSAHIDAGLGVECPAPEADTAQRRLGRMIGTNVVDARHEALASIEDLVVDVQHGMVDGAVLAFGGTLGIGERFVLLPVETLVYAPDEDVFVMASNRERLEMMAVPSGTWPSLDSDDWLLGGRERLAMAEDVAARERTEAANPAPPVEPAVATPGEPTAAEEQVSGTIMTMGTASQQSRGAPRLRLRVRTVDGREVVVLAGTTDHAEQAAFGLAAGQVVTVRGWRADQGPRSLLVARSLTVGERSLTLEDAPPDEIRMPS